MCLGYLSFGMMLAFLTKNSGLSLLLYFSYVLIVERILRYGLHLILPYKFKNAYPTETIDNLIPNPIFEMASNLAKQASDNSQVINLEGSLVPNVIYIFIFLGVAYYSFNKRDL